MEAERAIMKELKEEELTVREEEAVAVFDDIEPKDIVSEKELVEEPEKEESGSASTDAALAEINSRLSVLDAIDGRLKQAESRIGGINNTLHKAKEEAAAQPTPEQLANEEAIKKGLDEIRGVFPEGVKSIESRIAELSADFQGKMPDLSGITKAINEIGKAQQQMLTPDALEKRLLTAYHSDWEEVSDSAEFKEWAVKQPKEIFEKIKDSRNADDTIEVLNLFKEEHPAPSVDKITDVKKNRLLRSVVPVNKLKPSKLKSENDSTELELREKIAKEEWGK